MSKQSDKFHALLFLLAAITALLVEYWYIILPVVLIAVGVYYVDRQTKENRRLDALRAISVSDIDNMGGIQFEHYVKDLLRSRGYSAKVTSGSNDFGVDIIASKKGNKYAIQVKCQKSNVSRRAVSDAVAGMPFYKTNKCMVITNSYYSKGAYDLAKVNNCVLVDRDELAKWIIEFEKS